MARRPPIRGRAVKRTGKILPVLDASTTSRTSPTEKGGSTVREGGGGGRGRLPLRGRARRGPPQRHRPTARRPPTRGRAVKRMENPPLTGAEPRTSLDSLSACGSGSASAVAAPPSMIRGWTATQARAILTPLTPPPSVVGEAPQRTPPLQPGDAQSDGLPYIRRQKAVPMMMGLVLGN